MSQSVLDRIEASFGMRGFPQPLFYSYENALRFDLAGDHEGVAARFVQAVVRARTVAAALFAESELLFAVVCHDSTPSWGPRVTRSWRALKRIGFAASFLNDTPVPHNDRETIRDLGEDLYSYWSIAECRNEPAEIDALLWACIARELGVAPKARWLGRIYIVDFDRGLVLHAYDDRGMDVLGMEADLVRPLYEQFGPWLLDYDRVRMDQHFATG
jgi:hypothetical protein